MARAEFGEIPGHFALNTSGFRGEFVPDSGFGAGVYAVPLDADRLLAFDLESPACAYCPRIDSRPFISPRNSRTYYRFQCEAWWPTRNPLFVDTDRPRPTEGELLEWQTWAGDSAADRGLGGARVAPHRFSAIARPHLLKGRSLIASASYSGRYPPAKEYDELRGDSLSFGHYQLRSRILRLGDSAGRPVETWFESREAKEVDGRDGTQDSDGLEWAFLPEDASEKTGARFTVLFATPGGYLLVLSRTRDQEGAGSEEIAEIFSHERGQWMRRAAPKRTWMY